LYKSRPFGEWYGGCPNGGCVRSLFDRSAGCIVRKLWQSRASAVAPRRHLNALSKRSKKRGATIYKSREAGTIARRQLPSGSTCGLGFLIPDNWFADQARRRRTHRRARPHRRVHHASLSLRPMYWGIKKRRLDMGLSGPRTRFRLSISYPRPITKLAARIKRVAGPHHDAQACLQPRFVRCTPQFHGQSRTEFGVARASLERCRSEHTR
jgi:hypothetical protein